MTLTGRLHPLLVHFPIALVLTAAAAELISLAPSFSQWHVVAVTNVRAAAACAIASAGAGWVLASSRMVEPSAVLEWHRWLGLAAAAAVLAASLATSSMDRVPGRLWLYRIALFWAAALVVAAGHFGAVLVWGTDFLRP